MTIDKLIHYLQNQQSIRDDRYLPGLFKSRRFHRHFPYSREDDNIFFSGLIAFTLQYLKPLIEFKYHHLLDRIIEGVQFAVPYYQHWKGEGSYNFWRTNPSRHFPNGILFKNLTSMELPDDADDSCILHLVMHTSHQQRQWLKEKLENQYSNSNPIHPVTPEIYRALRGYPTFLGKRIPREMDCCVISNVLYFVLSSNLKLTEIDRDSIEFLNQVLINGDHQLQPFQVSPNYANTAVILYHLTRLAAQFPISELAKLRQLLTEVLTRGSETMAQCWMEKLLIDTSKLRLGLAAGPIEYPDDIQQQLDSYSFFRAGMFTSLPTPWVKWAPDSFFHINFKCPAYNRTTLLENLVLRESVIPGR